MNIKIPRVNSLANLFLTISAIGFLTTGYFLYERNNPQNLAFDVNVSEKSYQAEITSEPVGIEIKDQNIFLPIIPAEIKDNKWESSSKGISYLKSSVIPGQTGNSVLYGHNWPNLLGNLKNVKPNQKIKIFYADGSSMEFSVEYTTEVKPSAIDVIKPSNNKKLTIYTCSGFLDSKRFVVVAIPLV